MGKNEVPVRVDCLSHYCLALDFEFFFFFFFFIIKRPFRMDSLTDSTVLVGLSRGYTHTRNGWVAAWGERGLVFLVRIIYSP